MLGECFPTKQQLKQQVPFISCTQNNIGTLQYPQIISQKPEAELKALNHTMCKFHLDSVRNKNSTLWHRKLYGKFVTYCDHDPAMERNEEVTRGCGGYYLCDHGSPVALS